MTKLNDKNLISRPPIVVIMGHIDHGKSKLLDYIRKANVVEGEAGGITQHIGAYEAEVKCGADHKHQTRKITFLDTPGHEAFSQMRNRGAKIADIAVLVIAADEGIKPQTIEAYESIKNAGIPFIIAFNKMDKPSANPEKVKNQLAEQQIFLEGYGGNISSANISAKTGEGINELLDLILLLAEIEDMKADASQTASGVVIESKLDPKRGISATLLISNGKMETGMFVVTGSALAPVRIFEDFQGKAIKEASFSSPIKITGFNSLPEVGNTFKTFENKKEAEAERSLAQKSPEIESPKTITEMEKILMIPIVIKADMTGSAEAVEKEILKLQNSETNIIILKNAVGNIKEDDIKLISGKKNSVVLGFNVKMEPEAKNLAEKFEILFFTSDIIYKLSDWLKEEIEKRKNEQPSEKIIGIGKILATFSKIKKKQVVGGKILSGKLVSGKYVRIKREDAEIGKGKIIELQRNKMDSKEVNEGDQFGMKIESDVELLKDDTLEFISQIK